MHDLRAAVADVRAGGRPRNVRCPAHEDGRASLSVGRGDDGGVVVHCHASCEPDAVLAAAGLTYADLGPDTRRNGREHARIVETYDYTDEGGAVLYQVCRFTPKDFRQRRPDGAGNWVWRLGDVRRVLFGLPELHRQKIAYITEGEKDVLALRGLGLVATTNAGGAGKWHDEYAGQLRAAGVESVAILPDNDDAGRAHAAAVARSCHSVGLSAKVVTLPDLPAKGDVSDYLDAGHTREDLVRLVRGTALYAPKVDTPEPAGRPAGTSVTKAREHKPETGAVGRDTPTTAAPIDLAALLATLIIWVRRYVVVTDAQAIAIVLWSAHTHAIEAADCTPYLQITSATKRAGKTRLLEVLEPIVARPWFTGRTSAAALVRKVDAERPTLLLDESDAAFGGEKEYAEALRGILNTGYRRSGKSTLCVKQGGNYTTRDYGTFGAKAIAGIGALPDTVADRAIAIQLRRRKTDEPCERWRERDGHAEAMPLCQQLASWAGSATDTLRDARPALPRGLGDRQSDVWEPLLAIADLAGDDLPSRARQAALALAGSAEDTDITVELLRDVAGILKDVSPHKEVISTTWLIEKLVAQEDRPWATWRRGDKPITPRGLARLLDPLDVHVDRYTVEGEKVRGYRGDAFDDVIARYLPVHVALRPNPNEIGPESPKSMWPVDAAWATYESPQTPINTGDGPQGHIDQGKGGTEEEWRLP